MKNKIKDGQIEYLSKYNWKNPNKFNGVSAVMADIAVMVAVFLLGFALIPITLLLKDKSGGLGLFMLISTLFSQGTILLIALIFCNVKGVRLFGCGLDFKFDIVGLLPAFALLIGTFLLIAPAHNQFAEDINEFQKIIFGKSSMDELNLPFTEADMPYMLIVGLLIPLLPAICEEALFRGVVMNGLREFGDIFAILVSAALFALMHGNYMQIMLQFIIGCEIAFIDITTNNFFIGCAMHFANNLFSIIFEAIKESLIAISPQAGYLFNATMIIVGMILLCIGVIYYVKLFKFKVAPKYDYFGNPINRKFPCYKERGEAGLCLLLQKGYPINYSFGVDIREVKTKDNSGMLYFDGSKFRSFSKKSKKPLFYLLLAVSFMLSLSVIIIDLII